eukprot:TRINITY_DN102030_c0_g1_i1.p1 TRINITY_DN102030_c0_g1~~TRINITY_DN102030_c0_g1_i1.p1  ORF type:complete len:1008 (+),score=202.88 TRINITY_DN102030_c0_g1_i1:153-3026(+)
METQILEAQLASLLNVDLSLAKAALQRARYSWQRAIEAVFELRRQPPAPFLPRDASQRQQGDQQVVQAPPRPEAPADQDLVEADEAPAPEEPAASRAASRRVPPAKRLRAATNFPLKGTESEKAAPNPELFKTFPLREEQRKSLAWMLQQEARVDGQVCGGLLADKMGYGKTATTIGLISLRPNAVGLPEPEVPRGYLKSTATLVMCPKHLVKQWQEEFAKFLGPSGVEIWQGGGQIGHQHAGKGLQQVRGSGGIRILVLDCWQQLYSCTGADLAGGPGGFDVVLASSSLLDNQKYRRAILDILCDGGDVGYDSCKTNEVLDALRSMLASQPAEKFLASTDLTFTFECFYWHRVVLDEFHESESWSYRVREYLKSLGARHRWGLSGTPPFSSAENVAEVAELLWYSKGGARVMDKYLVECGRKSQLLDEGDLPLLRAEGQKFLDEYVRQNVSDLVEAIAVREHTEFVTHTAEERLIYRQACHDNGIFDLSEGYEGVDVAARAALLQRCAHFDLSGRDEEGADTGSAVQRLGDTKRDLVKVVQAQMKLEVGRAVYFAVWSSCNRTVREAVSTLRQHVVHADAVAFIEKLAGSCSRGLMKHCCEKGLNIEVETHDKRGQERARPKVKLQQPMNARDCYHNDRHRHIIMHAIAKQQHGQASRILTEDHHCGAVCRSNDHLRQALEAVLASLAKELDKACRSLQFFSAQLRGLSKDDSSGVKEDCCLCLESMADPTKLALLPCAHVFHTDCIRAVLEKHSRCPQCNAPVERRQMSSFVMELRAADPERSKKESAAKRAAKAQSASLPAAVRAHGTKVSAIATRLQQIRAGDSTSRVIVFVQWSEIEKKLAKAFQAHTLPFMQMSTRRSGDDLKRFQNGSEEWILILSLERAATGSNLTIANHVVFVHPMNASTLSEARAYEQQAIARVRRIGQERSEIHVWRFIARDTVDQHMSDLHQSRS